MKTSFIFEFIEEDNKLFATILTLLLTGYIVLSVTFILLKSDIKSFTVEKKNPKRFANLIMNLPVPVYKAKKAAIAEVEKIEKKMERKDEKKEQHTEKVIKENRQIEKKITPQKKRKEITGISKNILKNEPVQTEKKGQVGSKDIENLGMLNLISAIEDPSVELAEIQGSREFSVEKHNVSTRKRQTVSTAFDKELLTLDEEREDKKELKIKKSLEKGIIAKGDTINSSSKIVIDGQKLKPTTNQTTTPNNTKHASMRNVSEIENIVSGYENGMKFCYNKVLQKEESIRGNIVVKFTILGSGNTKNISIVENEIQDKRLESCIIGLIERWEFPTSEIEQLVVTYPLKFIKNS